MKKITKLVSIVLLGIVLSFGVAKAVTPSNYGLHEGDLIRATGDNDIFIVNQFGYKRLFLNPVIFNMYGHLNSGWSAVKTVAPATRDAFTTSSYYRADGDTKVYSLEVTGEDTGILHWVNKTQAEFLESADAKSIFTINGLELAWYSKGSDIISSQLGVKLAFDNPSSSTLPKNANNVELLKVQFNGSNSIKELTVKRIGLGVKEDFENVYLYSNGVRLTDGRTFNSDNQIEFRNLKINTPAVVSVVVDLNATPSNEHAIQLISVVANNAVSGLPLSGNTFKIANVSVGILNVTNSGTIDDIVVGQNRAKVAEFKFYVPVDNENVSVKSIQLVQLENADISNVKLVVDSKEYTGFVTSDDEVVFNNLSVLVEDGKSKKFEIFADIDADSNAGDKIKLGFERANDINGIGVVYGYGVSVDTSVFTPVTKTLIASGNLSVKSLTTETQVAYFGQQVNKVANFKFTAEESEGFFIEELNFDSSINLANNVDKIYITYKTKSGSTLTVFESVDGTGSVSFDSFADTDRPYVITDGSQEITVAYKLTNDENSTRLSDFKLVLDNFKAVGENSDEDVIKTINVEAKNGLYTYASYLTVNRISSTANLNPSDDIEFSVTAHSLNHTANFSVASGSIIFDVFYASNSVSFDDVIWKAYVDGNEISTGTINSSGTLTIIFDEDVELEDGDIVKFKITLDGMEDFNYDDGDRLSLTLKDSNGVIKYVDDFNGDSESNVQNIVGLDDNLPQKFYFRD